MFRQMVMRVGLTALVVFLGNPLLSAEPPNELSVEALKARGHYLRSRDGAVSLGEVVTVENSREAKFKKVPGLASGQGVSFAAAADLGSYLRYRDGRLILAACPADADKKDATFLVVPGLAPERGDWVSLELYSRPGYFVYMKNGEVQVGKKKADAAYAADATFRFTPPVRHKPFPVSGRAAPGAQLFDRVILKYLENIGCTAAELAVARDGILVYSRGYGWSDREGRVPMRPNTLMAIASCDKSITAAAIKQLARAGKLRLDGSLLHQLKIEPRGKVVDPRVWDITVQHLLDHKAGWQGEPFDRAVRAAHDQGLKDPIATETLLGNLAAQQLKDVPGTKFEYCNFCYHALRFMISKISGRPMVDYVRQDLCRPFGLRELREVRSLVTPVTKHDPLLVWNASVELPVPPAESIYASAPALCTYMRYFWLTGDPRDRGTPVWQMNGSWTNSTATMLWREDGIDLVFVFNGRSDVTHDEIKKELEKIIDALKR